MEFRMIPRFLAQESGNVGVCGRSRMGVGGGSVERRFGDGKQFSRKNGSLYIIKILSLTSENKTRLLCESDLVTVKFHSHVSY